MSSARTAPRSRAHVSRHTSSSPFLFGGCATTMGWLGKSANQLLRDELEAACAQIDALQQSLARAYATAEATMKDRDRAVEKGRQDVDAVKAEYSSKLEAAYALQAVTVDEAKADKDKLRTEIAKSTEQKEAGCRAEVAAAHAETVAARQAANVAKDMQEMAEEKVREIKRWVQKEHSELGRHVQRLNDQLAAKNDENVRLRELLAIHDKRLKEEERVKMETIQERDRIVAEIKRRQEKVDVLTGQSTNLEDENARIMALLEKEIGKVEELNLALKETQVKLAETEQVTAEKYHNMFLQNEWAKFSDAYDALLQRVAKLERQKEDAHKDLEAIRGRLRESKHLPHLGVQWVLWGKGNKAAAVQPSPPPSIAIQETAKATRIPITHRGPPPLPGKGNKAGNKPTPHAQPLALASNTRSAPSLPMRPKR